MTNLSRCRAWFLRPLCPKSYAMNDALASSRHLCVSKLLQCIAKRHALHFFSSTGINWIGISDDRLVGPCIEFSKFLFVESNGKGVGCTQASAFDSIFNVIVSVRYARLKRLGCDNLSNSTTLSDPVHPAKFLGKLICYTSMESDSWVEKPANIAMVEIRSLKSNQNYQVTGYILEHAIIENKKNCCIPMQCNWFWKVVFAWRQNAQTTVFTWLIFIWFI